MKNKILTIITIVLGVYVSIIGSKKEVTSYFFDEKKDVNIALTIKDLALGTYDTIDLEEYLIGVVAGEMPASFDSEALKAQAVASRTYALYKKETSKNDYDLTTDSSTQVYLTVNEMKDKWQDQFEYYYNIVKNAVLQTKGQVITYDDDIIPAYYFAMSNGKTETSLAAFGEDKVFLQTVDAFDDENNKNFYVTKSLSKSEFCSKLKISCDNITISNIIKSDSGRVSQITINDKVFTGTNIRSLLNLRSSDFEIDIKDNVNITTAGFGHGVGMSQYGANNMAKLGYNYEEILKHFYSGTTINNINSII